MSQRRETMRSLFGHQRGGLDPEWATSDDAGEAETFLAKGAFLLTPSYELSMEKASAICEKMSLKSAFSLTKTATGILFKFANPEDYQALFKRGFHKVTGARFYRKIPIPCRPSRTFTIFASDIPEEIPEEDLRHSLYKFNSVVEVTRLGGDGPKPVPPQASAKIDSGVPPKQTEKAEAVPLQSPAAPPPVVRITLASVEEANLLLQNGLDFYGATYFPTDTIPPKTVRSDSARVHDIPVFDSAGFQRIPPPNMRTVRPRLQDFGKKL